MDPLLPPKRLMRESYSDAYRRSRKAVAETQKRLRTVKARTSIVRAALEDVQSEQRALLSRNRDDRETLKQVAAAGNTGRADRFAAVVSHELRQPLNAALAAAQLVQVGRDAGRAMGVLQRQLLQMAELLDALLDMSRVSMKTLRLDQRRLDVVPLLHRVVETIEPSVTAKSLTLALNACPSPCYVFADERRLQQVFGNLLSNAVRYTPGGGHIEVSVHAEGRFIVTDVRDSGVGIRCEELLTIFEPFCRGANASAEGLGIGLALVQGLVELHGGLVRASSDGPGRGSLFSVILPRSIGDTRGNSD